LLKRLNGGRIGTNPPNRPYANRQVFSWFQNPSFIDSLTQLIQLALPLAGY